MEIVQNLFRTLMFFLDNIVYGLIPQIYKLFIYLSQLNLFGGDGNPLQKLINRVYVLLGIFMLFRVSFSLLQYIVDPSAFRDSSKGMGKLVTNVLVALVLLVSVPAIFTFATEVQATIVQNNVIGELILGNSMSDSNGKITPDNVETMAKDVQFMMFGAFYSLNPAVTEGNNALFSACNGTSGVFGSRSMATEECLTQLEQNISGYEDASANNVDLYSFFKHTGTNKRDGTPCVNGICDDRDFSHFDKLLWWKNDGEYVINYLPFISTAAGIYVVFLLITFCVDVAVRVIKLCFLQMIAPIAIVSYIDPKESISNGKLNSWIKECASTYFSLFLRLATIFLVMLLISVISSMVLADNATVGQQVSEITGDDVVFNIWIYLFLIIGAFMFAKQVPKMIESIFGMKGTGQFSLNPFKTFGDVLSTPAIAAGGAAVGGALGAGASNLIAAGASSVSGAKNFATNVRANWGHNTANFIQNRKNDYINFKNQDAIGKLKMVKGAVSSAGSAVSPWLGVGTGAVSGAVRGAKTGYTGKNIVKGANTARKQAVDARNDRDIKQGQNFGIRKQISDKVTSFAGIKNKSGGIGAVDQSIKVNTRDRENIVASEHAMRDAQTQYVANSRFTSADFEKAVYRHDEKGNVMINPNDNNRPVMRTYDEYLSANNYSNPIVKDENGKVISFDRNSGVLTETEFNKYSSMEQDIRKYDDEAERLRKQISDSKDLLDIQQREKK